MDRRIFVSLGSIELILGLELKITGVKIRGSQVQQSQEEKDEAEATCPK